MDLISRKAAVSGISDLLMLELKGQRIPTWNEVYNAIGDIPSVPAVPLDKVCAVLAKTYETPPCWKCERALGEEYCQEKECGCGSKEHWKAYFEKLMEGIG